MTFDFINYFFSFLDAAKSAAKSEDLVLSVFIGQYFHIISTTYM